MRCGECLHRYACMSATPIDVLLLMLSVFIFWVANPLRSSTSSTAGIPQSEIDLRSKSSVPVARVTNSHYTLRPKATWQEGLSRRPSDPRLGLSERHPPLGILPLLDRLRLGLGGRLPLRRFAHLLQVRQPVEDVLLILRLVEPWLEAVELQVLRLTLCLEDRHGVPRFVEVCPRDLRLAARLRRGDVPALNEDGAISDILSPAAAVAGNRLEVLPLLEDLLGHGAVRALD